MRNRIVLLFLLFALPMAAQQLAKMSIVSFQELPEDLSARQPEYERYDGNGDLFSIIKVSSSTPDDDLSAYKFSFGQMECQVCPMADLGELWLYVQRGAKHVKITRTGYTTIQKHDLGVTIPAGAVYSLELSAATPKARKQMVRFNITPVESKAMITYKSDAPNSVQQVFGQADSNGSVAKILEVGNYTFEVMSENCYPTEGRLILQGGETHVQNITLRPRYANISLLAGADTEILIDGESKGKGTWKGVLNAGSYNVETRKANHRAAAETIVVTEGKNEQITLKEPTPIVGSLSIVTTPLDVTVSIGGKSVGKSPLYLENVLIGTHTVTLSKEGFGSKRLTIDIRENETTEQTVELSPVVKQQEAPAQNSNSAQTDEVFTEVEVPAEFPGGMRALVKWLSANIRYPEAARLRNSQGRSFVKFIVNTDGSIQSAQVIKSSGDADLDKEAVRVVSNMPLWVPGKNGNKTVRTYFVLPVTFRLTSTESNNAKSGNYINGHEFVDLGLSVKWATCNVGANAPHETGGSYAWGETEEKSDYSWKTYKWQRYKRHYTFYLSKYCIYPSSGDVDNKKVLEAADDVASVKWGGKWRMPTFEEQKELWERCKWTRMTQNGVDGYQITGPNGKSIFLPNGYYWSSSLMPNSNAAAYDLDVKFKTSRNESRFKALLVRPVCN